MKVQIIDQVFNKNQFSIEDVLWEREKYWQAQLFTNLHGKNNINDLYSMRRKGYRKAFELMFSIFNDILSF